MTVYVAGDVTHVKRKLVHQRRHCVSWCSPEEQNQQSVDGHKGVYREGLAHGVASAEESHCWLSACWGPVKAGAVVPVQIPGQGTMGTETHAEGACLSRNREQIHPPALFLPLALGALDWVRPTHPGGQWVCSVMQMPVALETPPQTHPEVMFYPLSVAPAPVKVTQKINHHSYLGTCPQNAPQGQKGMEGRKHEVKDSGIK